MQNRKFIFWLIIFLVNALALAVSLINKQYFNVVIHIIGVVVSYCNIQDTFDKN